MWLYKNEAKPLSLNNMFLQQLRMAAADPVTGLRDQNIGHMLTVTHFSLGKFKIFGCYHPVAAAVHHHSGDPDGFPDGFYSSELFHMSVFFERSSYKAFRKKPA